MEFDQIKDFTDGTGVDSDTLDVSQVLTGLVDPNDASDLTAYLEFTTDGTDTTVKIDTDGGGNFGSPDQTIQLCDIDLVGVMSQTDVIQQLLDDGNLNADAS